MAEITIIGGINIDIEGSPFKPLIKEDSNPGRIRMAFGGVGRNIAENTARAGGNVAMISVVGDDYMGQSAVKHLAELGIDVRAVKTIEGENSSMYLSVLNHEHDMELAISDMDILENLTLCSILCHEEVLEDARVIALDANLNEELLEEAAQVLNARGLKLFFDPVSANKAGKARNCIGRFYAVKPNRIEAEVLSGISIETEADLSRTAKWFRSRGVEQVYITLNKDGVYYCDGEKEGIIRPGAVNLVSATGAGDSFSAMILLGIAEGLDIETIARMGMAAASIAMESHSAVNKDICKEEILRRIHNV